MSNTGMDIWGVISGAVGVLTVLPLLCAYVWSQHPETKFAQLDSALKDTENLLRSVVEEGLLDPERHVAHFELHLKKFRRTTEQYRDETFIASNEWHKLLEAWYNGLSTRISLLCKQVKAVRASICETSANARMQLMEQSHEEMVRTHHGWRAQAVTFWKRVVSLVSRGSSHDVADAPASASTTSITSASNETFSLAVDTATPAAESATSTHSTCQSSDSSLPPRKASVQQSGLKFSRAARTASRAHDLHVLTRAIRRVDRELAAQGVTNALLTQLVQATHKQWSPASSKVRPPRRARKLQRLVPRPTHGLEHANISGMDSDAESSGEETMCEI